eukprot:2736626-Pleurochrysis_carterae.AAC.1
MATSTLTPTPTLSARATALLRPCCFLSSSAAALAVHSPQPCPAVLAHYVAVPAAVLAPPGLPASHSRTKCRQPPSRSFCLVRQLTARDGPALSHADSSCAGVYVLRADSLGRRQLTFTDYDSASGDACRMRQWR